MGVENHQQKVGTQRKPFVSSSGQMDLKKGVSALQPDTPRSARGAGGKAGKPKGNFLLSDLHTTGLMQ